MPSRMLCRPDLPIMGIANTGASSKSISVLTSAKTSGFYSGQLTAPPTAGRIGTNRRPSRSTGATLSGTRLGMTARITQV